MAHRLLVGRESLHTDVHSAGEFVRAPTSRTSRPRGGSARPERDGYCFLVRTLASIQSWRLTWP
jgi:hypothetical protein